MSLEKSLDTKGVASVLSISEREARDLCLRGFLKGWKQGKRWRVKESEVERYIETRTAK